MKAFLQFKIKKIKTEKRNIELRKKHPEMTASEFKKFKKSS